MIKRPTVNRRNRRNFDKAQQTKPSNTVPEAVLIATVTVSFETDQTISQANDADGVPLIPQILSVGANGALPTGCTVTGSNSFDLTYPATQAASTDFIVPDRDPALRTYTGGWLTAGSFPAP